MSIKRKLIGFFYPQRCPFCNTIVRAEDIACDSCMQRIRQVQRPILRGAAGVRCVSSFLYDGKVRRLLIRVKFHNRTQHICQVAAILKKDIDACYAKVPFDLITYVPMHIKDQKHRGYNQSELLAKELGKLMNLPVADTLVKVKRTKKQHSLTYSERRTNLRGAFQTAAGAVLKDKTVLLVDDIITSGSTLGYCAKELSKARPAMICCATIANADALADKSAVI